MRRWMKAIVLSGIVGATLGISLAGERLLERRKSETRKTPSHANAEFFSRSSSAAAHESADDELDVLLSEASSTPKRFTRQRDDHSAPIVGPNPAAARKAIAAGAKSANESSGSKFKRSGASVSSSNKLNQQSKQSQILEELKKGRATELRPADAVEQAHKSARSLKPLRDEGAIQQANFDAESAEIDTVVEADYQQAAESKSRIQQVRAEVPALRKIELADDADSNFESDDDHASRVSVVNRLSSKPKPVTISRASQSITHTTIDRANVSAKRAIGTPSVTVEWVKRGEINVGQECACELLVKNTGKVNARQVIVEAFFPATVRLTQANPEPAEVEDHLEWLIEELPAGTERTIEITMIPSQRGELATTANVRFTGTAASVFEVAEPLLKVDVESPEQAAVGDPVVQTVKVSNPGTGVAQNVKVQLTIPDGLEPIRSDRTTLDIGSLAPGESRNVRLSFTAIAGGEQTIEVEASADSGLQNYAEATVLVTAPVLNATIDGPAQRFVGRDAKYTLTVANDGRATTNNVRVTHQLPRELKFTKADKGGTFDSATGTINWFVGNLEPRQTVTLKFTAVPQAIGELDHQMQVTSDNVVAANANFTTAIEGSAELALEIQDDDSTIAAGQETEYEIRASNTGSKAAAKVGLTFELPRGLELIDVHAVTEHLAKSGLILFNELPELAPGKTALYRVRVKSNVEGNLRVRARLTSESVDEEIVAEETTKFDAD